MMKTALALPLVLIGLLALVLILSSTVKAQEPLNLTIKPDGSVEPSTNLLERDGNTYTFKNDVFGTILVQTNNIVIDGAGHTLQASGNNLVGIDIEGRSTVTVKNVVIQGFLGRAGILVTGSNNCIISKDNLEGNLIGVEISGLSSNNGIVENNLVNNTSGIELESAVAGSNNVISGNDIANNSVGITLTYFTNTNVFGNTLTDNKYGFFVGGGAGSILRNNTLNGNTYGFHAFNAQGITALKGVDVDTSNMVNGKPIYYWVNQHDRSIPIDAGYVALISCTNITLSNLNLSGNAEGAYLGATENSTIINNAFSNNLFGVSLDASNNNTISKNIIADNENGIGLGAGLGTFSANNVIDSNMITGNGNGIYFGAAASNIVTRNNITNSATAIYTEHSGINILYNNNFINNTKQWFDIVLEPFPNFLPISVSKWDNGSAGNYWSDYLTKYPNATEIDASGTGNTPYVIYNNNADRFPLMKPLLIPEILIPEFPSGIIPLLLSLMVAFAGLLVYFKKAKQWLMKKHDEKTYYWLPRPCGWESRMNKLNAFLFVFLALSALLAFSVHSVRASGDLWIERAPMPNAESNFGAVSVNGEIYTIGYNFTYVFDSSADTWVSKTQMPSHRQGFAIAACQNKIYIIGGWNSTNPNTGIAITLRTNEMYDPATDTWTNKAHMPLPAANLQANVVNSKIYVISGMSDVAKPTLSSSNWVYDPSSNSWSAAAAIPTAVFNYASAVVDNKIYIEGGGLSSSPYYANLNQIYDPKTNSWTLGEPLPASLLSASAGATTGVLSSAKLYVIGGTKNGYDGVSTTQIYDPQTDSWTLGSSMLTARKNLAVTVVNDTVYALGGVSGSGPGMNRGTVYAIAEQYIPLDYQGTIPSPYIPTPSPYSASTPTPTPTLTPSPSPPEFTAKFVAPSIEVKIKNQPITAYLDANGSNPNLYYGFRFKDHENIRDWNYDPIYYVGSSSYGTYYKSSASDYTVVSFPLGSYPLTGILGSEQVDLQVMALIGNEVPTNYENGTVYGFDGVESVWSTTQTITIAESSNSPTQMPTPIGIGSLALTLAISIIVMIIAFVVILLLYKRHRKTLTVKTSQNKTTLAI